MHRVTTIRTQTAVPVAMARICEVVLARHVTAVTVRSGAEAVLTPAVAVAKVTNKMELN